MRDVAISRVILWRLMVQTDTVAESGTKRKERSLRVSTSTRSSLGVMNEQVGVGQDTQTCLARPNSSRSGANKERTNERGFVFAAFDPT